MKRGVKYLTLLTVLSMLSGQITEDIKLAVLRVSFSQDDHEGTTGTGQFLNELEYDTCGYYTIDPAPHDLLYFQAQLSALNNYYRQVSYGHFGLDTINSIIYPKGINASYQLSDSMSHYHRYGEDEIHEQRITELLHDGIELAYDRDSIDFSQFDLVVIFHAGIGQDFSLPFIDPTPEDIPSTYVDPDMVITYIENGAIIVGPHSIDRGIILPETQNHLLFDLSESVFSDASEPCDYQYGLTGTFALMVGFAMGLPPLWNIENGNSGIGVFGLMDQGSNNGRGLIPAPPDAWSRVFAGWEEPVTIFPGNRVSLPVRGADNLYKVEINRDEYFLIENRSNWIADSISIDSLRWKLYSEDKEINPDDPRYPPLVEVLFDSVDIVKDDSTGVVLSVPNYDLGMPASGLLIWHIDESIINANQANYTINANPEFKGVDLEEADGAQDLGFTSIFTFTDPSSGLFSDMWFQGNPEYERLYPEHTGQPLVFGPYTYPDTRSNSGASTYISIEDIGPPGDTMQFAIMNSLLIDGFPDEVHHIKLIMDLTGDGKAEVVGGGDSLWWSLVDSFSATVIRPIATLDYEMVVSNTSSAQPGLILISDLGDSQEISSFQYQAGAGQIAEIWSQPLPVADYERVLGIADENAVELAAGNDLYLINSDGIFPGVNSAPSPNYTVVTYSLASGNVPFSVYFTQNDGLTILDDSGSELFQLPDLEVNSLAALDLDLDGQAEIITTDQSGGLAAFNHNLTMMDGFPVAVDAGDIVLGRNLFDSDHPELVTVNSAGEILVINWRGNIEYRLANSVNNNLEIVTDFRGRSSIITESTIWSFDSLVVSNGNEWNRRHGGLANDRSIQISTTFTPIAMRLFDPDQTYSYPNPARGSYVRIRIFVESAEKVIIKIYDLAGLYVTEFKLNDPVANEANEIIWDISEIEAGVYFGNLEARRGDEVESEVLKIGIIR